jgi:Tol biopolymer transport system component
MKADGSEATNITNSKGSDTGAAWSPNGQSIAFTSTRDGAETVYVMNTDGSHVRRIAKGLEPAWSSDGRRIALTSDLSGHSDIEVVNTAGGGPKKLTKTRFLEFSPAWAPAKH